MKKLNNRKIVISALTVSVLFSNVLNSNAQTTREVDTKVVAVNELADLKGDEWAYKAISELVEKYDVLEGYPDGKFKGNKYTTRFELAAALYDLATYFGDEIAKNKEDLTKLAKLMDEFSTELKALQARVDKLEATATDHEGRIKKLEGTVAQHTTQLADHDKQLAEHKSILNEHEKRLAYAERRKGFIFERLIKGLVVDIRDFSRGLFAAFMSPFSEDISSAINKK